MKRFWMIYNPSHKAPYKRYENLADAISDANKMATKWCCRFFVLECIGKVTSIPETYEARMISATDE